jgi:hypothetical protein
MWMGFAPHSVIDPPPEASARAKRPLHRTERRAAACAAKVGLIS